MVVTVERLGLVVEATKTVSNRDHAATRISLSCSVKPDSCGRRRCCCCCFGGRGGGVMGRVAWWLLRRNMPRRMVRVVGLMANSVT
jgi:hypothetical protein